jgi:hypothetical protein
VTRAASSPSAQALQAARASNWSGAEAILANLVKDVFDVRVESLSISRDRYSLNSLNGFVRLSNGDDYFFKFHHEEGEEVTLEELYRGETLLAAGYPVDMPVLVSREVGRQLLLYKRRRDLRFSDVCERLDFRADATLPLALSAQSDLDELTCKIYRRTLHAAAPDVVAAEPFHQLFHHRLVSPGTGNIIGGRARQFFFDRRFTLPGVTVDADALRSAKWIINGSEYSDSIGALLERSRLLLQPHSLARFGAVVAHGDAHNANVWFENEPSSCARLVLFDPAFAGSHVCALLAEVKSTFHNVFAHPCWLYDPDGVSRNFDVRAACDGRTIRVDTNWDLSDLRRSFLEIKRLKLWVPLLKTMRDHDLLAADWRQTLRCALFCCPTLVMDLCADAGGGHTPASSAIALAVAVMVGSEPAQPQSNVITEFLDSIAPG